MTLELTGLTQDEQFAKASEFAGVPESVLRRMWKVESGEGENMRSPDGAEGHFQAMPDTRAAFEKRLGRTFNPYDFTESLTLAAVTMQENMRLAKGNLSDALRWYNAGAPERWDNPETRDYVVKVLGTDGDTASSVTGFTTAGVTPPSIDDAWGTSAYDLIQLRNKDLSGSATKEHLNDIEKGVIEQAGQQAAANAVVTGGNPYDAALSTQEAVRKNPDYASQAYVDMLATGQPSAGSDDALVPLVDAGVAAREAEEQRINDISLWDRTGAQFDMNTITSSFLDFIDRKSGPTSRPDRNFNYMDHIDEIERDRSAEEIEALRLARSMGEAGLIKQEQDRERQRQATATEGAGTFTVLATGLIAGVADPIGWVAGFGVGKAAQVVGIGSRAAFQAGMVGRGLAFAGTEGAAGNVLATATMDALGTHQSSYDYAMATGFGIIFGIGFGGAEWKGTARDIATKELDDLGNRILADSAEHNRRLYEQAVAAAGPGADADEIAAAATRINADTEHRIRQAILGDVEESQRLMPRPDMEAPKEAPVMVVPEAPPSRVVYGEAPRETVINGKPGKVVSATTPEASMSVIVGDDTVTIASVEVNEGVPRGKGFGGEIYRDVIDKYLAEGKVVESDGSVSADAARVYDALERRGYTVERNPEAVFSFDSWLADGEPIFRVTAGPEPAAPVARVAPRDSLPGALLDTPAKREAAYIRYNLKDTISDDAERKLVAESLARAEQVLGQNPIDADRLRPLLAKVGWEATSTRLLLSDSPVLRAAAVTLLENPEGAAGRRVTAAAVKSARERLYIGNSVRDYESIYAIWRDSQGGSAMRDFFNADARRKFDREVYAERDRRWNGIEGGTDDKAVLRAADILDEAYERMRLDQKYVGTVGSQRLAADAVRGYQPRRMSAAIIRNLSDVQRRAFLEALSTEFQATAGFDKAFSDDFAVKYFERLVGEANGAYDVPATLHDPASADIVRDNLRALGLDGEEIASVLDRFSRGGASHTKGRIDANLTTMYPDGAGGNLQLMDLVDTNNVDVLRSYARRVSGEVALARWGVLGSNGLQLLRKAATVGPDGARASVADLEAFDQIAAEFLGRPFGSHNSKWADNARSWTSAIRLGGMGFNQLNEYANGVGALGVVRVAKAVGAVPRLMGEVRALAAGKAVPNSLLNSIEMYGGSFGLDGYRMRGMYDVNENYEVYGMESLTVADKASRMAAHGNRVLSGHRVMTAVQTRGMAEQIVAKALRYIREGKEDAALDDMGFTAPVRDALRKELDQIAEFGPDGEVVAFDATRITDRRAAESFVASVYRGASQIIQETYVGETGKWAHDGFLRLLTQFRTYGLTATQKQWRRQSFAYGTPRALMLLMGAMSVALPIHMARVALRAAGMEDSARQDFLDRELSPLALGRATMNYVAAIGVLPDVLDVASAVTGGHITGGRAGNSSPFVGGQVIPAAGVVNDVWKVAQTRDPHKAVKLLPGSNLPYLQAAINQLDE